MAETSGVVNSTPSSPAAGGSGARGGKARKNKLLYIGGAIGGLFLFLSHKGSTSGSPSDTANLQAASNALAAQEAQQASLDTSSFSPAGVPVDTGGGSFTTQGPSATTSPAVELTVNATQPAGAGSGGVTATPPPPAGTTTPPRKPPPKLAPGWKGAPFGHNKPTPPKGYETVGLGSGYWGFKPVPKPKQAPKGKPAPASKKPNSKGSPQHPETRKKTPSGAKKKSPVMVESMEGFGSGVVVFGRHFPGATGHRLGPPRQDDNGDIARNVTVMYGGHTETHTCHGDGKWWTDRTPGLNPPSRGVAVANDPVTI